MKELVCLVDFQVEQLQPRETHATTFAEATTTVGTSLHATTFKPN
jgi:hypothetical protein